MLAEVRGELASDGRWQTPPGRPRITPVQPHVTATLALRVRRSAFAACFSAAATPPSARQHPTRALESIERLVESTATWGAPMMNTCSLHRGLRRLAPVTLLIAATAAAACGGVRRGPGPPPAVIYFTNESLDQASVYMVGPGLDFRRIGTVFAGRTDTLRVPADLAMRGGTLNIVARMLARSDLPQTGPISIRPGGQYQVRLPTSGRLLSFLPAD
jgi:hypothetical protein